MSSLATLVRHAQALTAATSTRGFLQITRFGGPDDRSPPSPGRPFYDVSTADVDHAHRRS